MFGILEAVVMPQEGVYHTYESLIDNLNQRMEKEGYKIVKARSHRSRIGGADIPGNEIVRCDLVCDRGGRPYKCMATKHKTSTKKTDCPWKAKAVNRKASGGWVLTIVDDRHNHEPESMETTAQSDIDEDDDTAAGGIENESLLEDETSISNQPANISNTEFPLNGQTFDRLKAEYSKLSPNERFRALGQLRLRIAALHAAVHDHDSQQARGLTKPQAQSKRRRTTQIRPISEPQVNDLTQHIPPQLQPADTHTLASTLLQEQAFQLQQAANSSVPPTNMTMQPFQHYQISTKRMRNDNPNQHQG